MSPGRGPRVRRSSASRIGSSFESFFWNSLLSSFGFGFLGLAAAGRQRSMPQSIGARKVLLVFMSLLTIKRHSGSEVYDHFALSLFRLLTMYYMTNTL